MKKTCEPNVNEVRDKKLGSDCVWRSDRIVILQDTEAAVCLIRRPSGIRNNTFSGFIENVQTD